MEESAIPLQLCSEYWKLECFSTSVISPYPVYCTIIFFILPVQPRGSTLIYVFDYKESKGKIMTKKYSLMYFLYF